jgi:hypothetical protein
MTAAWSTPDREPTRSRRDEILAAVSDLVVDFLYYDRKEDEELPRGAIEDAVAAGEITVDEIVEAFRSGLGELEGPQAAD